MDHRIKRLRQVVREVPRLRSGASFRYTQVAAHYFNKGIRLFKTSPKLHLFAHLCEWQACEMGNPRYWWCYSDEDMVGLMVDVAESCHPVTLAVSALFKWLHLMYDDGI